jgi:UDP-glucuronate 4-epimerase
MDFMGAIEKASGVKAKLNMLPMQQGYVVATQSDTSLLRALVGRLPETPVATGVERFVDRYKQYYR